MQPRVLLLLYREPACRLHVRLQLRVLPASLSRPAAQLRYATHRGSGSLSYPSDGGKLPQTQPKTHLRNRPQHRSPCFFTERAAWRCFSERTQHFQSRQRPEAVAFGVTCGCSVKRSHRLHVQNVEVTLHFHRAAEFTRTQSRSSQMKGTDAQNSPASSADAASSHQSGGSRSNGRKGSA